MFRILCIGLYQLQRDLLLLICQLQRDLRSLPCLLQRTVDFSDYDCSLCRAKPTVLSCCIKSDLHCPFSDILRCLRQYLRISFLRLYFLSLTVCIIDIIQKVPCPVAVSHNELAFWYRNDPFRFIGFIHRIPFQLLSIDIDRFQSGTIRKHTAHILCAAGIKR